MLQRRDLMPRTRGTLSRIMHYSRSDYNDNDRNNDRAGSDRGRGQPTARKIANK